ncbi:MAG: RNA polymerase sigma factor [Polyangiales bacterium]
MTDRPGSSQADPVESAGTADTTAAEAPRAPPFEAIFQSECSYVFHTLRRLGVRERDLEDVAHEVFLTIHKKLGEYDPSRPLRPWIFAFAYRFAADYRKRAQYRREVASDEIEPVDAVEPIDERLDSARARQLVVEALEALDLDKRAVFVMHEIDGVAIPEVARTLGVPLNTAYSRLRLAREAFAQSVKRVRARGESEMRAKALANRGGK